MPTVRCGLEVLVHDQQALLQGRRVARLAHQASVDSRYARAASLLGRLRRGRLVRLLAPEHGLWGAAQDHARVGATRDPATGLPVFSLYGSRPAPTRAMLRGADVLVVDLQDIGARYYTFVWTMALSMQACARVGVGVVVLDRPNPLGGAVVEGNVPDPAFASFVGLYPLPARHALTIGALPAGALRPLLAAVGRPRRRRRAGARDRPRALQALPDGPRPDRCRQASGAQALRLAPTPVRVRAQAAADRHPVRDRRDPSRN